MLNIYCVLGIQSLAQGYLINALKMSNYPSQPTFQFMVNNLGLQVIPLLIALGTTALLSSFLCLSLYPSTSITDPIVVP